MSGTEDIPPLVFATADELRRTLVEAAGEAGRKGLIRHVEATFTAGRELLLGDDKAVIFAVQLRELEASTPGAVLLDYSRAPTPENSKLFATVTLVELDPNVQLVVRAAR